MNQQLIAPAAPAVSGDLILSGTGGLPVHMLAGRDCEEVLAELQPGSVDVIVTSPPYNLGIRYNQYDDTLPRAEYLKWVSHWAALCSKVLSADGSIFLNVGSKPSDPWIAMDVAAAFRDQFVLQNTIHWIKSISVDDREGKVQSYGHYKPISSKRFVNDCQEYIFHFTRTGSVELDRLAVGVPYQDKSNIDRWSGKADLRCRGNVWYIPYETIVSRLRDRPHPATFPARLAELCFRLHGLQRIKTAMDPFMGLGSTAVAAARLGLNFVGCEIDSEYLRTAADRIAAELLRLF